jgi:Flp pilus assembly protein TadG
MAMTARPTWQPDQGAAAVELAMVLPLLLVLVCGIVDLGRLTNLQITISAAAREGARWAALNQSDVAGRVSAAATGVVPPPATAVTPCPAGSNLGANATVVVTSRYTPITPIRSLSSLLGGSFPATVTITGRGVMRCGA